MFDITQDLIVGRLGHGDVAHNHQFGGSPTINAQRVSVAVGVFSDSTLLIDDATWTIDDSIRLGIGGTARLELADATLSARELDLAVNATSVARAEIVSASLTIDETARIGVFGRSRVRMSGVSTMNVGSDLVLGAQSEFLDPLVHGEGSIEMTGNADLLVGRDLWLSMLGEGDVLVEQAAAVSVDRDLRTVSASDATLHLRPSNVMTEPMVQIGGRSDSITLIVEMVPTNYLPVGASRTLLVAKDGIDGAAISVIDSTIDGARRFHVTNDGFTVQVHVTAAADLNDDGVVGYADLLVLLGHWGACPSAPCLADLTGDGVIDFNDLLRVLDAWTE